MRARATGAGQMLAHLLVVCVAAATVAGACITKTTTATLTSAEYNAMYTLLSQQVFTNAGKGNVTIGRGDFVGGVVRLAFHDAGEFSAAARDGLRADGCVDLTKHDNGGLAEVIAGVDALWQPFCNDISRADFWVLAAKVAIEMSGPADVNAFPLNYAIPFRIGRVDRATCTYEDNRLPSARKGFSEIRRSLMDNLGLSKKEAIALLGAHCLGRAERRNSGYNGAWVTSNNVFQNSFYFELLNEHWAKEEMGGDPPQVQWETDRHTMMLNTDMSIAFEIGADDGTIESVNRCKSILAKGIERNNCPFTEIPENPLRIVKDFASDNNDFLWSFAEAFKKMSEKGYDEGELSCFGNVACGSTRPKCKDSTDWKDARGRNCAWVSAKPASRCSIQATQLPGSPYAWKGCPLSCMSCTQLRCNDDVNWNAGSSRRSCEWVAQNPRVRCMIVGLSGERGYAACPVACQSYRVCE